MSASTLAIKSGVYGVIPDALLNQQDALIRIKKVLQSGLCALQYRDKRELPREKRYAVIASIRHLCKLYNTPFIVNNSLDLALEIDADGLHLGQDDLKKTSLKTAKKALGKQKILGISVYNSLALAQNASLAGAHYVSFGCCFPSFTKPNAPKASLDIIQQAKKLLNCQVVAIGGINVNNATLIKKTDVNILATGNEIFLHDNFLFNLKQLQFIINN